MGDPHCVQFDMPGMVSYKPPAETLFIRGFCDRTLVTDFCPKNKVQNRSPKVKITGTFTRKKPGLDRSYVHDVKIRIVNVGTSYVSNTEYVIVL